MTDNERNDADLIERDIRETQDQIGETIDKLEEQLRPQEIARSLVGEDGSEAAKEVLEITRRNPVPVALIAIGVIWLLATARTRDGRSLVDRFVGETGPKKRRMRTASMPAEGFEGSVETNVAAAGI
jgi:hypothetical protein